MKRLFALSLVVFSLLTGGAVSAAELQKGITAFHARDYETAIGEMRPLAEQGVAKAQFFLGLMYVEGYGVVQDREVAARWLKRSADQGEVFAQSLLGAVYMSDQGMPANYKESYRYYRLAADQGEETAMFGLGAAYRYGLGVKKDPQRAIKWYLRAADKGFVEAYNVLGEIYENGDLVPRDLEVAEKWYRLAAEEGDKKGLEGLTRINKGNFGTSSAGTSSDVLARYSKALEALKADDLQTGIKYLKPLAREGHAASQFTLGMMHSMGEGLPRDRQESVRLFLLAAKQGHAEAQHMAGLYYSLEETEFYDLKKARKWLGLAADQGIEGARERLSELSGKQPGGTQKSSLSSDLKNSDLKEGLKAFESGDYTVSLKKLRPFAEAGSSQAQLYLGLMFDEGNGVKKNEATAVKWFKLAAEQGESYAQALLGLRYQHGLGVRRDYGKALKFFRLAFEQGFAPSAYSIGEMYRDGTGVAANAGTAREWFLKAADLGHDLSLNELGKIYEEGMGVPSDLAAAGSWYKKAVDKGYEEARPSLARVQGLLLAKKKQQVAATPSGVGSSDNSGSYQEAIAAIQNKNYDLAVKYLRPLAKVGDADAQVVLAALYAAGKGVAKNPEEALRLYNLAADQGHAKAQSALGFLYSTIGSEYYDPKRAVKWMKLSAARGDEYAIAMLKQFEKYDLIPTEDKESKDVETKVPRVKNTGDNVPKIKAPTLQPEIIFTGDLKAGIEAYEREDYYSALELLYPLAEEGVVQAQFLLGEMFREGRGVTRDTAEAIKWIEPAAEQGLHAARYLMGKWYYDGKDLPQDYKAAYGWFKPAAEQGHELSQFFLGLMYHYGDGVAQDHPAAIKWYQKSYDGGFKAAETNLEDLKKRAGKTEASTTSKVVSLSNLLPKPKRKPANIPARKLSSSAGTYSQVLSPSSSFNKASNKGGINADLEAKNTYLRGQQVFKNDDLEGAYELWAPLARKGHFAAEYGMALLSFNKESRAYNEKRGVELLKSSAEGGFSEAQYLYAYMFQHGFRAPRDTGLAVKWYQRAAMQDHVDAQINLGHMYNEGRRVVQDKYQAWLWYSSAALQGSAEGSKALARLLKTYDPAQARSGKRDDTTSLGQTTSLGGSETNTQRYERGEDAYDAGDYKTAHKLWLPVAEDGLDLAQYTLGYLYETGKGVIEDDATAVRWYKKSAKQGFAPAQFKLGTMYQYGTGVRKNQNSATRWYKKGAAQSNSSSQFALGMVYMFGMGVPEDPLRAFMWWSIAAEQGDKEALRNKDRLEGKLSPAEIRQALRLAVKCTAKEYRGC